MDDQIKDIRIKIERLEFLLSAFIEASGYEINWENQYIPELKKIEI